MDENGNQSPTRPELPSLVKGRPNAYTAQVESEGC